MFFSIMISFNRPIGVLTPMVNNIFLAYPFGDHTQKRVYEVFSVVGKRIDIIPTEKAIQELYMNQGDQPVKGFVGLLNSSCNTLGCIIKFYKETFIKSNDFLNNFWGWV